MTYRKNPIRCYYSEPVCSHTILTLCKIFSYILPHMVAPVCWCGYHTLMAKIKLRLRRSRLEGLCFLAHLYRVLVWMASILYLIFCFLKIVSSSFRTIPGLSTPIGITIIFNCHLSSKIQLFFCLLTFFCFYCIVSDGIAKSSRCQVLFFLLINITSGLPIEIWWFLCISKRQRILCVSFPRMDAYSCIYHSSAWPNFSPLLIS